MRQWACLIAVVLASVHPLPASETDPTGTFDTVASLVRGLGSPSFVERERATRKLTDLGIVARDALAVASADPDAEVRTRAGAILKIVTAADFRLRLAAFIADFDGSQHSTLPGWPQFSEQFGNGPAARELFVQMQQAEPELLAAYAANPALATAALNTRLRQLFDDTLASSRDDSVMSVGTVASLLLVGAVEGVTIDTKDQSGAEVYGWLIVSQSSGRRFRGDSSAPILRKLFGAWIVKDVIPGFAGNHLLLAANYGMKAEGLLLAEKILKGDDRQQYCRHVGLLALGRFGGPEFVPLAEKSLTDATICNHISLDDPQRAVDVQTRDVALAVLLHLTGQPIDSYSPNVLPSMLDSFQVPILVFTDDAQRQTALNRWSQWRSDHPQP